MNFCATQRKPAIQQLSVEPTTYNYHTIFISKCDNNLEVGMSKEIMHLDEYGTAVHIIQAQKNLTPNYRKPASLLAQMKNEHKIFHVINITASLNIDKEQLRTIYTIEQTNQ